MSSTQPFPIAVASRSNNRHVLLRHAFAALVAMFANATQSLLAAPPAGPDFQREIQPVLKKFCFECHGAAKQEGGLRLDSFSAMQAGGDSGAALVVGKSADSLLIKALAGNADVSKMPPQGKPAPSETEINRLRTWIDAGAHAPTDDATVTDAVTTKSDHWAFRAPARSPLPNVANRAWSQRPLDWLVLAKLEQERVAPSPEAARTTLLRRLHLDLTGIPPTPDEVATFLDDTRPDAVERLTDRLLNSPAYGERWGRHWLDQARYADSNGYTRDFGRDIWPFRDWVIQAINRDTPFDQFTVEQLAGDLLPNASLAHKVATGFHRNTLINEEGGTDQEQFRVDAVADRVSTTGQVWLGLTLGCARCHNHKYDPISQREFYQLFAFFNTCDEPTIEAPTPLNVEHGDLEKRQKIRDQIAQLDKQVEARREELERLQQAWEKTVTPEQRARLPGPVQVAYDMPFEKRDEKNKRLIEDYYRSTPEARQALTQLDEIAKLREVEPKIPRTMVLAERKEPRETHIHKRGDFLNLGIRVRPEIPAVFRSAEPSSAPDANRLTFARWLVARDNPLTPRVIVNRQWQQLFGRGIVETDDDFGTQGTRPTHPELLDWLAVYFSTDAAWSMKRLHREIVTSATYRQSSRMRPDLAERDPRNEWLARQSRLRVDAEIVRDVSLATGGLLTREIGGPSVMPPQPDGVYAFTQDPKPWKTESGANRYRRGLYTFFWRSLPYPMLTTFDAPNANVTCTRRLRSNTPLQSLTLANDVAFVECARAFAKRTLSETTSSLDDRVRFAFRAALARDPAPLERERFIRLVNDQRSALAADEAAAKELAEDDSPANVAVAEFAAWIAACRVLLNLDEFISRE